jgi:hypothetical protein
MLRINSDLVGYRDGRRVKRCTTDGRETANRYSLSGRKLIPLDGNARTPFALVPKRAAALPLEPLNGAFIAHGLQNRLEDAKDGLIVFLDPAALLLGEEGGLDELGLDGDLGEPLEAEPAVTTELALGVHAADDERALDAYAPVALLVVPRLVRQHMPGLERDARVPERLWPLVHVQERPDAVPRPVQVVQPVLPQRFPCQDVELRARRP